MRKVFFTVPIVPLGQFNRRLLSFFPFLILGMARLGKGAFILFRRAVAGALVLGLLLGLWNWYANRRVGPSLYYSPHRWQSLHTFRAAASPARQPAAVGFPRTLANGVARQASHASLYLADRASRYVGDIHAFEQKVRLTARQLDIPPEWLMAVMYLESRFDPSIQNLRGSGATGLIQFMPATVRDLNARLGTQYYMKDIRAMTALEQMPLVHEYLQGVRERQGEFNSLTDLYLGILYPRALGQDVCFNIFTRPSRAYRQNSGLDENRDGVVTVGDIDLLMKRMFPTAFMTGKKGIRHGELPSSGMELLQQEARRFLEQVLPALLASQQSTNF